jgi:hypothetical protein
MSCAHCGFDCTAKGKDMNIRTFRASVKLAKEITGRICLGGGEPTIHPRFWDFMSISLATFRKEVTVVTNGSQTETSLALAHMSTHGVIHACLSLDDYHDPIEKIVVDTFKLGKASGDDRRGVVGDRGDGLGKPLFIKIGRAAANGIGHNEYCLCDNLIIDPDGKIWRCGCRLEQYGTVFDPKLPKLHRGCYYGCSKQTDSWVFGKKNK